MRMCERKLLRELNPRLQSVHLSLPGTTVLLTRSGLNLKTGSSENKKIQKKNVLSAHNSLNSKQRSLSLELIFKTDLL